MTDNIVIRLVTIGNTNQFDEILDQTILDAAEDLFS